MASINSICAERVTKMALGRWWRTAAMTGALCVLTACGATTATVPAPTETGATTQAPSAADAAAKLRVREEIREKYPNIDVTDDYALAKALFEESRHNDPGFLGDAPFPDRLIWEANSSEPSVKTILAARQASIAAALAALPPTAPERVAQAQARLKDRGMPWVAISESGPHDFLNLSSVAPHACAIETMQFSVNGALLETQEFSSCEGGRAMAVPAQWSFDLQSVNDVRVTIVFTDGSRETRYYARSEVFWR